MYIGQETDARNNVPPWVQHPQEDEGAAFAANKDSSYLTRYVQIEIIAN